jgi:hypothetical protein
MIAEGDQVVCRVTVAALLVARQSGLRGRSPLGWVGYAGTALVSEAAEGKRNSIEHVHIFRTADRLITEHWAARADLSLLLQLGAISPPP